ncbi:unnamed protein product [Paramecium octaurelia]|uniref:Uncharacterized protein n=1 Tax=Paramecium octaurelia TaxID=43137 RepID=A0A8S1VIV4_PAROT|nr:unnamed protein product [Paramecium octaurelia]
MHLHGQNLKFLFPERCTLGICQSTMLVKSNSIILHSQHLAQLDHYRLPFPLYCGQMEVLDAHPLLVLWLKMDHSQQNWVQIILSKIYSPG